MPPNAEQRRPDTQVSRTALDGGVEIATHPCRNHGRIGVPLPDAVGDGGERPEGSFGIGAERSHRHHTVEPQLRMLGDGLRDSLDVFRSRAAALGPADVIEVDLNETANSALCVARCTAKRLNQTQPVDRVHQARVPHD